MTAKKLGPIRTYAVTVEGYSPVLYSARSPAKARWRCFQDYGIVSTCSFGEFLAKSTIRVVADPPGIGQRILVCGRPATRVIGRSPNSYMLDDGNVVYCAHETEVQVAA